MTYDEWRMSLSPYDLWKLESPHEDEAEPRDEGDLADEAFELTYWGTYIDSERPRYTEEGVEREEK